jgi:electron transfer flavoprotein beta subunit
MSDAAVDHPLNILVCIKFVRDPNQLQADAQGHPDLARAPLRASTFDDNAIEAGLQLCAKHGGRVFGLAVTSQVPPRDVLLRALAMGLEALYVINDEAGEADDTYRVAVALAAAARAMQAAEDIPQWDVVLAGEASADQYNAQIGPRLAVALGIGGIPHAIRLDIEQEKLIADRTTEIGAETLEMDMPAVVTVGTEINQARIPTVLQVMGAQKKRTCEMLLSEVPGFDAANLDHGVSLQTLDVTAPPTSRKQTVVKGDTPEETAANLIALLGADGEVELT